MPAGALSRDARLQQQSASHPRTRGANVRPNGARSVAASSPDAASPRPTPRRLPQVRATGRAPRQPKRCFRRLLRPTMQRPEQRLSQRETDGLRPYTYQRSERRSTSSSSAEYATNSLRNLGRPSVFLVLLRVLRASEHRMDTRGARIYRGTAASLGPSRAHGVTGEAGSLRVSWRGVSPPRDQRVSRDRPGERWSGDRRQYEREGKGERFDTRRSSRAS